MWAAMIVLQAPLFNDLLCFSSIGKYPTVQTIGSKSAIETLNKRIFPGAAWFNVERLAVVVAQPFLDGIGNEFRAIVAAQVIGATSDQEQPSRTFITCRDEMLRAT